MMNDDAVTNRQKRAESQALDLALVRRIVDGEEAALRSLYDRYGGLVYSVALRVLRDAQAAEEILQDIFHHLWKAASRFDPARGSLPGWLLVTTRNRSIDRLRRRTPEVTDDLLPENIALPGSAAILLSSSIAALPGSAIFSGSRSSVTSGVRRRSRSMERLRVVTNSHPGSDPRAGSKRDAAFHRWWKMSCSISSAACASRRTRKAT